MKNVRDNLRRGAVGLGILVTLSMICLEVREYLSQSVDFERLIDHIGANRTFALYWCVLAIGLLLPFSPSAPVLAIGLTLFGPEATFFTALSAGIFSSSIKYLLGARFTSLTERFLGRPLQLARMKTQASNKVVFTSVLALHLLPHPLYDIVGYAAGALRLPFFSYICGAIVGGGILLALFCYSGTIVEAVS